MQWFRNLRTTPEPFAWKTQCNALAASCALQRAHDGTPQDISKCTPSLFCFVLFLFVLFCFVLFLAQQPPVGQDLLILEVSRSHTTAHHSRQDSSGRVISSSQRPLPDNTQHSQQTSMPLVGFEPTTSVGVRPQIYVLDGTANGIDKCTPYIC